MKSTSFININGDIKQSKIQIIIYVLINLIQNIYFNLLRRKFIYLEFKKPSVLSKFNDKHSISRKLCSLFWKNINWKILIKHMGLLNIHEIGSGDGTYFKEDISIKSKFYKKYKGCDINFHKKWKFNKNKKVSFSKFNGVDFYKTFNKGTNLFISQSCLEHVRYDLKFFNDLKSYSKKSKKKIVFIHCVPSPFCLFTYLTHGFRQYNIGNVNKISSIFENENMYVCKLGNVNLNIQHLFKTTFPLIFKNKNLMKNQNKNYYSKVNKDIIFKNKSSIFFSSFIVMIGFINLNKIEKKNIINNFFV